MIHLAPAIIARRMEILNDFKSPDPVTRELAKAEWREAGREKVVLVGMAMNPLMWNPLGAMMVGAYASGKMTDNFMRLYGRR